MAVFLTFRGLKRLLGFVAKIGPYGKGMGGSKAIRILHFQSSGTHAVRIYAIRSSPDIAHDQIFETSSQQKSTHSKPGPWNPFLDADNNVNVKRQ